MSESRLAYSDIQKTDPLVEIQFALQFSKRNGMPLPEKIQYILENNLPIIYLRHISNGGSLLQCDSSLLRVLKILTYFDPRSLPGVKDIVDVRRRTNRLKSSNPQN